MDIFTCHFFGIVGMTNIRHCFAEQTLGQTSKSKWLVVCLAIKMQCIHCQCEYDHSISVCILTLLQVVYEIGRKTIRTIQLCISLVQIQIKTSVQFYAMLLEIKSHNLRQIQTWDEVSVWEDCYRTINVYRKDRRDYTFYKYALP